MIETDRRCAFLARLATALLAPWLLVALTGCLPDSGGNRPEGGPNASSEFASTAPDGPPAPPLPPAPPPRVSRPDAPDVAPAAEASPARPIAGAADLRRQPTATHRSMHRDQEPAGVVSWEAKPDPPTSVFHYEISGRYLFPIDRGVEVVMPAVPSHYLLLANRGVFRNRGRDEATTGCAAFDLRTGKIAAMIKDADFADSRGPMAISPNGVYVVDGTGTADLRVWSFEKRALFRTIRREGREGPEIVLFLDSTRLLTVTGSSECAVEILSVETGQPLMALKSLADRSPGTQITSYALSPGGRQMAIVAGQTLHVLDLNEGRETGRTNLAPFSSHGTLKWVGLAFRSDGRRVAAVGYSSDQFRVACWDMETGSASVDYIANLPPGARLYS
ncbi:MAG: hypothetical protein U1E05_23510, partial [Patescibacteria group bacterium]|nr:hypothetical protein [Patescibacteria group bacterium]